MKEIVINACYGGFGLSPKAIREYLILLGKESYFYKHTKIKYADDVEAYTRVDNPKNEVLIYTALKDFGKKTNTLGNSVDVWFSDSDIPRDDKNLITVVKKLGDKASGACANLKIVEIPDDVVWEIEEHNGFEHVAEKHRTWE